MRTVKGRQGGAAHVESIRARAISNALLALLEFCEEHKVSGDGCGHAEASRACVLFWFEKKERCCRRYRCWGGTSWNEMEFRANHDSFSCQDTLLSLSPTMPVVRSAPRQLVVLHPAPYALPAVSSLEFDMPHPLEPNPSFSSTEAGPSTLASSPQFSPKRIRKAAKRVAKEEGKQLVEQGELRMTVMGQGGPGEVSAAKVGLHPFPSPCPRLAFGPDDRPLVAL